MMIVLPLHPMESISLNRFARPSSHVADFSTPNKLLTQKLLKQDYRYHKLRKTFSKFYRWYYDLISKFQSDLNLSCAKDFWNPSFMVTWLVNWRRLLALIISHYKKLGYYINVLQQTACLVINPITVGIFVFLFNCTPVGWSSDSTMVPT